MNVGLSRLWWGRREVCRKFDALKLSARRSLIAAATNLLLPSSQ